jgi:NADH-dependant formate dehydrogenase delta subunit FdsD.
MDIERLVTMANDITDFFHGAVSADEVASSVATHLRRYWDPRMRKQIIAHWQAGAAGLSESAKQGVAQLASQLPAGKALSPER